MSNKRSDMEKESCLSLLILINKFDHEVTVSFSISFSSFSQSCVVTASSPA